MYTKEQQTEAIRFYLQESWDKEAPMVYRVKNMLREANRYANGHPEWSDIYGIPMKPIDEVNKRKLEVMVAEFLGAENMKAYFAAEEAKEKEEK